MREPVFIKKNTERWKGFEQSLTDTKVANPDLLADLFIQLTDDLSYARTHYPDSKTTTYLNNLTGKVHQSIYKNRKESKNRFVRFWAVELPTLFYSVHRQLLYSFIIFMLAVLVGVVSTAYDEKFPNLILGDNYVNMTLENIKKGDPMAVYKRSSEMEMFLSIPLHNIQVSFKIFIFSLLSSLFTGVILVYNGIMLGAFQYFFYKYGLLATSALTIWIHGTLEISAIVIAGCAGLVMGNSILFPGTYSRMDSFRQGATKGLKIMIGLIPIFLVAGFLESFITRLTEMPTWGKLTIIIGSALFIIWYFIVYPILIHKKNEQHLPKN